MKKKIILLAFILGLSFLVGCSSSKNEVESYK